MYMCGRSCVVDPPPSLTAAPLAAGMFINGLVNPLVKRHRVFSIFVFNVAYIAVLVVVFRQGPRPPSLRVWGFRLKDPRADPFPKTSWKGMHFRNSPFGCQFPNPTQISEFCDCHFLERVSPKKVPPVYLSPNISAKTSRCILSVAVDPCTVVGRWPSPYNLISGVGLVLHGPVAIHLCTSAPVAEHLWKRQAI